MRPLFLFLVLSNFTFAQQLPLSGNYWKNRSYYNPAFSAYQKGLDANLSARSQWTGLTGSPYTILFNANYLLKEKHGLGITYIYDEIGFYKNNEIRFNYNYQLLFSPHKKIIFGATAGYLHKYAEPYWIYPSTSNDPTIVAERTMHYLTTGVGASIYWNRILGGVSLINIGSNLNHSEYTLSAHLVGSFQYELPITRRFKTQFEANFMTGHVSQILTVDARALAYNHLWFGGRIRSNRDVGAMIGYQFLEHYLITYSVDFSSSKLNKHYSYSHNATLSYSFKPKPPKIISMPNF